MLRHKGSSKADKKIVSQQSDSEGSREEHIGASAIGPEGKELVRFVKDEEFDTLELSGAERSKIFLSASKGGMC